MKRFLRTCAISVLILSFALSASALTKEEKYTAALDELAAYVSSERENLSLDLLMEQFSELGAYRSSQSFLLYIMILSEIEKTDDPDYEDIDSAAVIPVYLSIMRSDTRFTAYLEENAGFGTLDDLENYAMGRLSEKQGNLSEAYSYYRNANAFMDSITRLTHLSDALFSDQYALAVRYLSERRYEEAYNLFSELDRNGFACGELMNTAKMLWESSKPKEHKWIEADCTSPAVCSECGETKGSPLGHDYADATCEDPATCLRCGHRLGTKLGHSYSEATCTKPAACVRCGLTSGYKLDHDYTDASCTQPSKCANCGKTTGAALGHKYTEATCTQAAYCLRCGSVSGTARPHNYSNATCSLPATCYDCGKTTGSPLSHSWTQATCVSLSYCRYCGVTTGYYGAHSWRDATYTQPKTCTVCGITSGEPMKRPLSVKSFSFGARSLYPTMDIGTRTGPGNGYAPMNTYPSDLKYTGFYQTKGGSVNWAYVEFTYRGSKYRLYTGVQRFSNSGSLTYVTEEYTYVTVNSSANLRYGPGYDYAESNFEKVSAGTSVKAFYEENGWVMIDFTLRNGNILRGWIPQSCLS